MPAPRPEAVVQRLWWLTLLRGLVNIALGLVVILWPGLGVQAFFVVFGVFSIADGVVALGTGVLSRGTTWGWTAFQGVGGILVGMLALTRPQTVAAVVVVILALWALLVGLFGVAVAFQLRGGGQRSWLWAMTASAVIALLGVYFLVNPEVGAAFLAVTVGSFTLVAGGVLVFGAVQLRRTRPELLELLS